MLPTLVQFDSSGLPSETNRTNPLVKMVGVNRSYGSGRGKVEALRSVDLAIYPGDYVAITGPSGSGKSTLLHLLGLLDQPSSGQYHFNGVDITKLPERYRSDVRGKHIGFVFQAFYLLPHRSALENVMLASIYNGAPRSTRIERARKVLVDVGLTHRIYAFPATMSGGEQQRVALARAVSTDPDLLLLDEPTGNLDSANAAIVVELLDKLNASGLTVVLATHDPEIAAHTPRRITVRDGQVHS